MQKTKYNLKFYLSNRADFVGFYIIIIELNVAKGMLRWALSYNLTETSINWYNRFGK